MNSRAIQASVIVALMTVTNLSVAQQSNNYEILLGFSVYPVSQFVVGSTNGPNLVTGMHWPQAQGGWSWAMGSTATFDNYFQTRGLFDLSMGVWVEHWQTAFVLNWNFGALDRPSAYTNSGGFELSGRHEIWKSGLLSVQGIASIARWGFGNIDRPFEYGFDFKRVVWIPGIGVGAKLSVLQLTAQLHGWPGLVIAHGAEPNGIAPGTPGQLWYTIKPITLNYAISLTAGLEFDIVGF
jgi:hypothetical protein